jgi:hypothetical protein
MADGTAENGFPFIKKVPGRLIWQDITLGRGISADMALRNWRRMVDNGNVAAARKNGSIVMYDQAKYY